jgi:UDPglucose 6-dehydrogenase
VAYDPKAIPNAQKRFIRDTIQIDYADSIEDCLKDAECCMILTEWDEFKSVPAEVFNQCMKRSFVIDGRRVFDPSIRKSVALYRAIGLGARRSRAS